MIGGTSLQADGVGALKGCAVVRPRPPQHELHIPGIGFRISSSILRVWGPGCRVWGVGFRV